MISNRLAPNRNVLFNIARTYELLGRAPEAYRYYTLAGSGETEAKARAAVTAALERIAPRVAILEVVTDPPGATVYLDRRDLGPRGLTPRTLGLAAGRYRVLVELAGYEPARLEAVDVVLGRARSVSVSLERIVGKLTILGAPAGAEVRIGAPSGPLLGRAGEALVTPAGSHLVYVTKQGFEPVALNVVVPARGEAAETVRLAPITGQLIVNADLRDSLIVVDGQERGFTPAVLTLPVGRHRVRVVQSGFRPSEHEIVVAPSGRTELNASLSAAEQVGAASRVAETIEEAPASVSIITREELRSMGYPTIAEALRGVRGLYLSDDRAYGSVGIRGFSRPGDYGNRVLVLFDGHPSNDNYVWSSFIGYDARVDLEDVERIEIVRGPGSVVYGTSAFLGVINVVTRDTSRAKTKGEVGVSTADYGVGRARVAGVYRFSKDAGVWASVAAARATGRDFYFSEYHADPRGTPDPEDPSVLVPPELNAQGLPQDGWARGVDGFRAATVQGRAWWRDLTVQWMLTSRNKQIPTGSFGTIFNDPRTHFVDTRSFMEARYEPHLSASWQSLSRAHVDAYDFDSFTAYRPATLDPESAGPALDAFRGRWGGLEQRFLYSKAESLRLTFGATAVHHARAEQRGSDDAGSFIVDEAGAAGRNDPFSQMAAYAVGDAKVHRRVRVSAGARVDHFTNLDRFELARALNPRLALILSPYRGGTTKFMGGKAFRTPSVYELFYTGPLQERATGLQPEQIVSVEVEHSHRFSPRVVGVVAGYHNTISDLVELAAVSQSAAGEIVRYQNSQVPVRILGGEVELRRELRDGVLLSATYSLQSAEYLRQTADRRVPNSPAQLASFKAGTPILARVLRAMTRVSVEGPRFDDYTGATDPPQERSRPGIVWDLVLSGEIERVSARWNLGVYNLTDSRYQSVTSREHRQRFIVQNGRTALASVSVDF